METQLACFEQLQLHLISPVVVQHPDDEHLQSAPHFSQLQPPETVSFLSQEELHLHPSTHCFPGPQLQLGPQVQSLQHSEVDLSWHVSDILLEFKILSILVSLMSIML